MTDDREGKPSCSDLHRHIACLGYAHLKAQHPDQDTGSKASKFGDDVHEVLKFGDIEFADAESYVLHVAGKCDKLAGSLLTELFWDDPPSLIKESRAWLVNSSGERVLSGRSDLVAMRDTTVLLMDYKALPGDVAPADSNWQILGNLVCLQSELERGTYKHMGFDGPAEKLFGAIIQPAVTMKPVMVPYDAATIEVARNLIESKLDEGRIEGAPRTPGGHCANCPVSSFCLEGTSMAVEVRAITSVDTLNGEQLAEIMGKIPAIEGICKAIRARTKAMAIEVPGSIPGYAIKDMPGDRFITDLRGIRDALAPWLSKEEFGGLLRTTLTALQKAFSEKYATGGTTKTAAIKELDKLIQPFVERSKPSSRLVKSDEEKE